MKTQNVYDILKEIDKEVNNPFITERFGDNWKEFAIKNYDINEIIEIAWKQGRKAILLEDALKKFIK
jgi:hypothetical protein